MNVLKINNKLQYNDPEFSNNLQVNHETFLQIATIVKDSVKDSVSSLTGEVREKAEFKVAIGLHHLWHC